jgi:hypothetical protein
MLEHRVECRQPFPHKGDEHHLLGYSRRMNVRSAIKHFAARGRELIDLVCYRLLGSMTGVCTTATA